MRRGLVKPKEKPTSGHFSLQKSVAIENGYILSIQTTGSSLIIIYTYIYISIFWSFWYTSACLYRLNHVPMISGHIGRTYTTAWKSSTWSQGRKDPGSRRKAMKKSKDPIPNLRPSSPFHKCPTVSIKYSWYVLHCDLAWPVRTGVWGPVHPCWCFWWPRRDGCPTYRRQVFVGRPKETPQSGGGG